MDAHTSEQEILYFGHSADRVSGGQVRITQGMALVFIANTVLKCHPLSSQQRAACMYQEAVESLKL